MTYRISGGVLIGLIVSLALTTGITAHAATNQAPVITSAPVLTVSADAVYTYQLTGTDADGDSLTWNASIIPDELQLTDDTIVGQLTHAGTYNVVVEVTDGRNGWDTQTWQILVTPGTVYEIVVKPNDVPTVVSLGSNKQFLATAYDAHDNVIPGAAIVWTTDVTIGTIGSDGLFLADKAGTGFVAATVDAVKASIGVVVKDSRADLVTETNTNQNNVNTNTTAPINTNQSNANTNTAAADTNTDGTNTNAETNESTPPETAMSTDTEVNTDETACTNMSQWALTLILIIYGLAVMLYYRYERTAPTAAWWILPLLLTIIGLIIYYQNICPSEYLWWPWVLVSIGAVLTIYYKGKRSSRSHPEDQDQTQLPV